MAGIIVGADPGAKGAFAKLDPVEHTIEIFDMPTFEIKTGQKKKTVMDHVGIGNILDDDRIMHLYIEEVSARPGEGVVSSFTFGRAFGTILGACGGLKIPVSQVRPALWKSQLKIPAEKDAARYRASQYFPKCATAWKRKMDDGRAEAALISFYGFCALGYQLQKPFTLIGELAD
jgi:crossover junction endodeoxyribonuclease RuvC